MNRLTFPYGIEELSEWRDTYYSELSRIEMEKLKERSRRLKG